MEGKKILWVILISLLITGSLFLPPVYAAGTTDYNSDQMTVEVLVRDEDGPVWNHPVWLVLKDENNEVILSFRDTTDVQGKCKWGPFMIGEARRLSLRTTNPGVPEHETVYTDVVKPEAYDYQYTIPITRYGSANIYLRDENNGPVPPGVPLWVTYGDYRDRGWPWNAPAGNTGTPHHTTDAMSKITLKLPYTYLYGETPEEIPPWAGNYSGYPVGRTYRTGYWFFDQTVNMIDKDGVDHTPELRYELPGDPNLYKEQIALPTAAGQTLDYYFYVRPLGKVTAQAVDKDTGKPAPDVEWDFTSDSGFTKYQQYGDDGSSCSIYGYGNDALTVSAVCPSDPARGVLGYFEGLAVVNITAWGSETVGLQLEPYSYGTVSGRILDPAGNGIPDATVELLWPGDTACNFSVQDYSYDNSYDNTFLTLRTVKSNADGSYLFRDVIPSAADKYYTVRAIKNDLGAAVSGQFSLNSGEDVALEALTMRMDQGIPSWPVGAGLEAVAVGWSGVVLQWPAAIEAEGDNSIAGYRVYRQGVLVADTGADYGAYGGGNSIIRHVISGLVPLTNYSDFAVQAYNDVGKSSELLVLIKPFTTLAGYDAGAKVIRASLSAEGLEGTCADMEPDSFSPAISADGRFVAFVSMANNFCPQDYNEQGDIFLFDRRTGSLQCLTLNSEGDTGNSGSYECVISADGRFVVFQSYATDFIPGVDNNYYMDVYLYDTTNGLLELISADPDGKAAGRVQSRPSLSGEGRYIVFSSYAGNLVNGESNGKESIYVRDRDSGITTRLDYPLDEGLVEGAYNPVISADGRYIACEIYADAGGGYESYIYVYNREDGTAELVSRQQSDPAVPVPGFCPSISADGRYIAFSSTADTLVEEDLNGYEDVFVYDRVEKKMILVSVSAGSEQGNGQSAGPAISADGRFVAFKSKANNLVPEDNNSCSDVFVRDIAKGITERVSIAANGLEGNKDSFLDDDYPGYVATSAEGRYVAFDSWADNLVPNVNNAGTNVYIYDRGPIEEAGPGIMPRYHLEAVADSAYIIGETADGIKTMTVNSNQNGLKYFKVSVEPLVAHEGMETVVFTHFENGLQLQLNALEADFDEVRAAEAGFNVHPGDVIKVYIVDKLTNEQGFNPTVLQ